MILRYFFFALFGASILNLHAQSVPESIQYQAALRDSSGSTLKNQEVHLLISIRQGTASGSIFYTETHLITTNEQGMVSLQIGRGVPLGGTFSAIDWSDSPHFIDLSIDDSGGTNFSALGTTELASVPYALYAESAASDNDWQVNADTAFRFGPVAINHSSPETALDVNGEITIRGGTPEAGKVLTSDDDGRASWQQIPSNQLFSGDASLQPMVHIEERLFATLNLNGTGSGNVMQGFTVDNRNGDIYASHRYSSGGTELSIINHLRPDGDGNPVNLGNTQSIQVGHPQDLSIEYLNGDFRLWTSSSSERGLSRINYNGGNATVTEYEILSAPYKSTTPSVSTNNKLIAVRAFDENNPTTNDRIFVYNLTDIIAGDFDPISQFVLHQDQMVSEQWFQGIVCDNDVIYCLTGDSDINTNKLLYGYTLNGELVFQKELTTGKSDAQSTGLGSHWEPEGMSLFNPTPYNKSLLIGIVSGNPGFRVKRVYSLGLGKGSVTIDGDLHPYDGGLHFSGGSKDISYEATHALQFGQFDGQQWQERMRLNSNGHLLIGTTSSSAELTVAGDICYTGSSSSCSDLRYKSNVLPLQDALEKIRQVKGVSYHWKTEEFPDKGFSSDKQIGLIAQELEQVYPELVHTDDSGYKRVDYPKLTAVLLQAINDMQPAIDELNSFRFRLAELERRVIGKEEESRE